MTGGWQLLKHVQERAMFGNVGNGSLETNEFFIAMIVATILKHNNMQKASWLL